MAYYVYILKCADGSYYTGSTSDLGRRMTEHVRGALPSAYTFRRRPIDMVWSEELQARNEALLHEHQIKGWSRAKKEALIRGDFAHIHEIVRDDRREREARKACRAEGSEHSEPSRAERSEHSEPSRAERRERSEPSRAERSERSEPSRAEGSERRERSRSASNRA